VIVPPVPSPSLSKFVPVIVTFAPLADEPELGETEEIVGASDAKTIPDGNTEKQTVTIIIIEILRNRSFEKYLNIIKISLLSP
jgi:hypothetical protein